MNLGQGIIGDEDARVLNVQRTAVGSYVDGLYVEGAVSSFQTSAIVVPIDGEARMRQPEGSRSQESIRFFAPVLLRTTRDEARQVADKVTDVDGRRWLVDAVDDWIDMAGYCDCMAVALAASPATGFIYFGAAPDGAIEDIVAALTKVEKTDHLAAFTANAGPNDYVWYFYPSDLEDVDFEVSGFVGGTQKTFTNIEGVNYTVLFSVQLNLGLTDVKVTRVD